LVDKAVSGRMPSISPLGPSATCSTSAGTGNDVKTSLLWEPTSFGELAHTAPLPETARRRHGRDRARRVGARPFADWPPSLTHHAKADKSDAHLPLRRVQTPAAKSCRARCPGTRLATLRACMVATREAGAAQMRRLFDGVSRRAVTGNIGGSGYLHLDRRHQLAMGLGETAQLLGQLCESGLPRDFERNNSVLNKVDTP
jgi:hypothetical protein